MKNCLIIFLCFFVVASWAFFIFIFLNLDRGNIFLDNALVIENKLDSLNDAVNVLWEERAFTREMQENLAYYLPEGFSSKVTYTSLNPLDLDFGEARVYFIHRNKNYMVDFSYYYNGKGLQVHRKSPVTQVN